MVRILVYPSRETTAHHHLVMNSLHETLGVLHIAELAP